MLQLFTDFSPCARDCVRMCRYLYVRAVNSLMGLCKCDERRELCAVNWIDPIKEMLSISIKYRDNAISQWASVMASTKWQ